MAALDSEYVEATRERYQSLKSEETELKARLVEIQRTLPVLQNTLILAGELPDWPRLPRPHAIRLALLEAQRALSVAEITEVLNSHGRREVGTKNVTATLAQMKDQGRVERLGPDQWGLTEKGREDG